MTNYFGEANHALGSDETIGILVINLGTPDAPTANALRRYLAEFLWDPRIVEIPRLPWWLILHGLILRTRPAKSARAYQKIWTDQGSPLLKISQLQTQALNEELTKLSVPIKVELGMRYGNPSIKSALEKLRAANVHKLLVLPLYPQYSATTTASTFDAVADIFKTWRWIPELRIVNQYFDDEGYIQALANSIREAWAQHEQPQKLLFSFHGMPERFFLAGDPYYYMCQTTANLVAQKLGLSSDHWALSFQSRFGRAEWLKPYTQETLENWGRSGVTHVDVICPGFSADCLETLEEIDVENRNAFINAGGQRFHYIPALNDRKDHIHALREIVHCHTQGWFKKRDEIQQIQETPGTI